jgi:hydroxyethylthiazole kinase-like uncharacterized protein yjeF
MIPVLSREQNRAFDRRAIEGRGVPSLLLMENAGRGAAEIVERAVATSGGRVVVVAGGGNNGGDGFVVARRLLTRGHFCQVFLTCPAEQLRGDARITHDALLAVDGFVAGDALVGRARAMEEALRGADVIVDGIFGTGLDRDVTGPLAELIREINSARGHRIALDIPSGLCADTGRVLGAAVRAHQTVTFAHPKLGLLTPRGGEHAGRIHLADIGIPSRLLDEVGWSAELVEPNDVTALLAPRARGAHKGGSGRVVVIAGSPGKTGAALLVARGALRAGAGLVTIATFAETARALDRRVLEAMTASIALEHLETDLERALDGADAVVIGPGLGLDEQARRLVDHVVLRQDVPKVVDADALTHLAGRLKDLRSASGRMLLTPHPGELGRLLGMDAGRVEADRFAALERAVDESHAAVLLKGAHTLVGAPGVRPVINSTGSPVLATGGSGDVLAGVAGALLAVLESPLEAGYAAAYVHGRVADHWGAVTGADRGMLAREIADGLPAVFKEVLAGRPRPGAEP